MRTLSTRDAASIATALRHREPFRTHGALSGEIHDGDLYLYTGRMSADVKIHAERVRYIVRSYATPIAFLDTELGWQVPDERYSVTTTRHQSKIRHALHLTGEQVSS